MIKEGFMNCTKAAYDQERKNQLETIKLRLQRLYASASTLRDCYSRADGEYIRLFSKKGATQDEITEGRKIREEAFNNLNDVEQEIKDVEREAVREFPRHFKFLR